MRYACLVYCEPGVFGRLSPGEQLTLDRDSLAYDDELERRGNFIHADALQPVRTAVTLRVRDGKLSSTDGPFAETKEHLCGFILIDAASEEEAAELAAGIPMARYGSIELRPVHEISLEGRS